MTPPPTRRVPQPALVAARGCGVVLGAWLAWTLVVAAYAVLAWLASPGVRYVMDSPATALLALLGYFIAPVLAGVACSSWIHGGPWRAVLSSRRTPE
ncbi:hypothetical protein [Streptacidiphilus jiangxiensis]|uniref:Uncharacterized protein n=1 Tax=Streptacidiphilus jiangxiensis TaxID=235985 RepID=A0A1H7Y282_STRJI|nr:hypothetical protein [Streptacidiphilus jiangxiensis]SEM40103.1 hypothetical protein SAMN05414137_12668 [Streptacidiphilus jiangxiensis]